MGRGQDRGAGGGGAEDERGLAGGELSRLGDGDGLRCGGRACGAAEREGQREGRGPGGGDDHGQGDRCLRLRRGLRRCGGQDRAARGQGRGGDRDRAGRDPGGLVGEPGPGGEGRCEGNRGRLGGEDRDRDRAAGGHGWRPGGAGDRHLRRRQRGGCCGDQQGRSRDGRAGGAPAEQQQQAHSGCPQPSGAGVAGAGDCRCTLRNRRCHVRPPACASSPGDVCGAEASATTTEPWVESTVVLLSDPVSVPVAPAAPWGASAPYACTFGMVAAEVGADGVEPVNPDGGLIVAGACPADAVFVAASQTRGSPLRTVVIPVAARPVTPEDDGTAGAITRTVSAPEYDRHIALEVFAPDAHVIVNVLPSVPSVTRQNSWNWLDEITAAGTAVNPAGVLSATVPRSTTHSRTMSPAGVVLPVHDGLLTV